LFIRVFGGVFAALLAASLLCLLLFHALNHVRFKHYQEELAAPLFRWLSSHEGTDSASLVAAIQPEGVEIRHRDRNSLKLSAVQRERLQYGHTLVDTSHTGSQVVTLGRDGQLVTGFFPSLYRDINLLMARLVATQVQALSPAGQEQALPILAQRSEERRGGKERSACRATWPNTQHCVLEARTLK